MIEVKDLVRKYGAFTAVKGVNFSIPKGQIIGLLGHNGAGKTTTIKMLTGYLEPSAGSITVDGLDIQQDTLEIQKKIGYLPESSPTYPEMAVVDYLQYVGRMRGLDDARLDKAVATAMHDTDLLGKADQRIATLSKGYRQRVGVAQAILHEPDILILDEPTNGLDPTQILAMRNLIKKLSAKATVILSTHIMQEVEAICDRVLIILDGRLVVDSELEALRSEGQLSLSVDQSPGAIERWVGEIPAIEAVQHSEAIEGALWKYRLKLKDDGPEVAAHIAQSVVSKGWNLYSLSRERQNLETVFRQVSGGGAAHE